MRDGGSAPGVLREDEDGRPPICPACGVTTGIVAGDDSSRFVCLECGYDEADPPI